MVMYGKLEIKKHHRLWR